MTKILFFVVLVYLWSLSGLAQAGERGGYSTGAYSEVGSGETFLQRVSDWGATIGMSKDEKEKIKAQRRQARRVRQVKKDVDRKKRQIEKKQEEMKRQRAAREN